MKIVIFYLLQWQDKIIIVLFISVFREHIFRSEILRKQKDFSLMGDLCLTVKFSQ